MRISDSVCFMSNLKLWKAKYFCAVADNCRPSYLNFLLRLRQSRPDEPLKHRNIGEISNGPFVALAKAKILAPSDPFLNFSFPSYGRFREGDPPTQQKVLPHLTVGALTDSNSPCALRARAG